MTIAAAVAAEPDAKPTPAPEPAPAFARTVWEGVYSKEQVVRGRRNYNALCARCHGEALGGGEDSPALVEKDFLKSWYGKSLGELIEYTREEMPSDGPGKVTRKQSTDMTAYVLSMNGFPAGETELPPDLEVLNQIAITPKK
ncbi:MAG: cytochrome c [Opitutaceae bacterium]